MEEHNLCFAWNWEYDADFVQHLETACQTRGLSLLQITPEKLGASLQAIQAGEIRFKFFFDRASDADERFLSLVALAQKHASRYINRFDLARRSWNKATCHLEFITAGLQTPYTIIIPSFCAQPNLPPVDLRPLGSGFSIKPAHGGGGEGVITGANSWEQVLTARQQHPDDYYLLQAYIVPANVEGREAWFRVLYCTGKAYLSWWNTSTHVYTPISPEEEAALSLQPLHAIAHTIARVSKLELFSSEIAHTAEGLFVVVDYLNDPMDLRPQSKAADGIPDAFIADIAGRLAEYVAFQPMNQPALLLPARAAAAAHQPIAAPPP
jgi:hypothetical protein